MGKRRGYGTIPMSPHSVVLSVIGAALLWVGWFGFNAGSALSAGGLAVSAFCATHFAAAAATLGWMFAEWLKSGKPTVLGAISGAVAGLVVITPASGYVTINSAIIMGLAGGVLCFFAATALKHAFGYDDSLDAFGVHGVGGTLGALLTGVFASDKVNPAINSVYKVNDKAVDLSGSGAQFFNQLIAVGITWAIALVGCFVLLKIVNAVVGLRPKPEEETQGLDLTLHGESAYNNL
jgi:Amt family ammonium transporter